MHNVAGIKMSRRDAINKVRDDLQQGKYVVPACGEKQRPEGFGTHTDIKVKSRPLKEQELLYWMEIGVRLEHLNTFNTTAISHSWTDDFIAYHGTHSYAYRIGNMYQIYKPFAPRDNKFRNNFTDKVLPGYLQLPPTGNLCIIGKAFKEVIAQSAWGFPSVAPRGENIPISQAFLDNLRKRFKRVVSLFDNDGKHQIIDDIEQLYVPISSGEKDPTDFARTFGVPMAIEMMNDLLWT
jgi:hypothetical protein